MAFIALAAGLDRRLPADRPDRRADPRGSSGSGVAVQDLRDPGRRVARRAPPAGSTPSATTQVGPDAIGDTLDGRDRRRRAVHRRGAGPARPAGRRTTIRDDLVAELERAGRALAMVEHGATILASVRGGARELEAQTSIKRGYLNLIHAREAIARHALAPGPEADESPAGRSPSA